MPVAQIAARLSIPVKEVEAIWNQIMSRSAQFQSSGYQSLCELYTVMAHQYQMIGDTMAKISQVLGEPMSPEKVSALLGPDGKNIDNLFKNAIILNPFIPPPPTVFEKEAINPALQ